MRQRWWATALAVVTIALHTWACGTEIAPEIESERRYQGTVQQAPPPAPLVQFDMSLFLRKLASGQHGVTGGFSAGPVRGSVAGTLTGSFDEGQFSGRLIAAETRVQLASTGRGNGLVAFAFVPLVALLASQQDAGTCVVEQTYVGEMTPTGIVWTPREVVRACPTNPLNFTIQATPLTEPVTTSVATTSSVPTTSTTSTTTSSVATTSVATSSSTTTTTTIPPTTTTTTTTIAPPPTTTTTSIRGI